MKYLPILLLLAATSLHAEVKDCPKSNLVKETSTTCTYEYVIPEYCQYTHYKAAGPSSDLSAKSIRNDDPGRPIVTFCREEYTTQLTFRKAEIVIKY